MASYGSSQGAPYNSSDEKSPESENNGRNGSDEMDIDPTIIQNDENDVSNSLPARGKVRLERVSTVDDVKANAANINKFFSMKKLTVPLLSPVQSFMGSPKGSSKSQKRRKSIFEGDPHVAVKPRTEVSIILGITILF